MIFLLGGPPRVGKSIIAGEIRQKCAVRVVSSDSLGVALELFQTINRQILKRTGVDHNIGIKLPVRMHMVGLNQVQGRLSDAVCFPYPPLESEYKKNLFKAICEKGCGQPRPSDEQIERRKANLISFGIPEEEAVAEIERELEMDFLNKGNQYHTVITNLLTWSFGVVEK